MLPAPLAPPAAEPPTEDGLVAMLRTRAGGLAVGALVSGASVVARLSLAILLVLGAGLVLSGAMFRGRTAVHQRDPEYADYARTRRLVRRERSFAWVWAAAGIVLCGLAFILPPVAVAATGVATTVVILARGIALGSEAALCEKEYGLAGGSGYVASTERARDAVERAGTAPDVPLADLPIRTIGRKRPRGKLSAFLTKTLVLVAFTGFGFAGVVAAHVVTALVDHVREGDRRAGAAKGGGAKTKKDPGRVLSYAELCPQLPDPLAIGHGLGELFRHDGAVEAGCGERALAFAAGIRAARGMCGTELRSLAIAAPARPVVLLYGEAAAFAWRAAVDGVLLHAERALRPDGDLSLVTTTNGTTVFARASPSVAPRRGKARRCDAIDETARPFTVLRPPLAHLWYQHVKRFDWVWPVPDRGRTDAALFVDPRTGATVASGSCAAGCELRSSRHPRWTLHGVAFVELGDLLAPAGP